MIFRWAGGFLGCRLTIVTTFEVGDIAVQPVPLCHGRWNATGYRVGSFAYLADCSGIPESSFQLLEGVETVVIDALHWREHPTHLSFEQAFALNARLGARRMVLTHLTHEISYREDSAKLRRLPSWRRRSR